MPSLSGLSTRVKQSARLSAANGEDRAVVGKPFDTGGRTVRSEVAERRRIWIHNGRPLKRLATARKGETFLIFTVLSD